MNSTNGQSTSACSDEIEQRSEEQRSVRTICLIILSAADRMWQLPSADVARGVVHRRQLGHLVLLALEHDSGDQVDGEHPRVPRGDLEEHQPRRIPWGDRARAPERAAASWIHGLPVYMCHVVPDLVDAHPVGVADRPNQLLPRVRTAASTC